MNKAARRKSLRMSKQATELMFAVPQVVAHRLGRMNSGRPSARDRREFQLMSSEKVAAFGESWSQMAVQMLKANQRMAQAWASAWFSPFRITSRAAARRSFLSTAAHMQGATLQVLASGLGPVHRRATANAKRLGRVKGK
ncbi:MAG: polyhydroxyalkanoate granule-associated phasin [Burkholderiaceae bacterium]